MAENMKELVGIYQEFNGSTIEELEQEPSPLEFMRYVSRNRPFIVRHGALHWPAVRNWNVEYLKQKLRGRDVQVAITPNGRADAATRGPDGNLCFAKPMEKMASFDEVLEHVCPRNERSYHPEVWYAQTQNDNMRGEYAEMFEDVARDIDWARVALQKEPDAINMWIGNSRSTTALHRDPYENVYVQIVGCKRFTLVPPAEMACVNERMLPVAVWTRDKSSARAEISEDSLGLVRTDEPAVPCALWDPDNPDEQVNELSRISQPLRFELSPGDVLYLPALWYHRVSQIDGAEGFCCSVNYWYDMEFSGSFYAYDQMVRQMTMQK